MTVTRKDRYKIKQRREKKIKHKKKQPPFLHFHIGDLHTRRWTWTWLGGRRTWLGGRLEPLREFGILPFLLGGLAGITCLLCESLRASRGSHSLPLRVGGRQLLTLESTRLVPVCGFPMSSGLDCESMRSMQWVSMCSRHLGPAWANPGGSWPRRSGFSFFPTELPESFQSKEEKNEL